MIEESGRGLRQPALVASLPEPASGLGPTGDDPARIALPAHYPTLTPAERREVRQQYARLQDGKCCHCKGSLDAEPPQEIRSLRIDWRRFPPNFLRYPHHLHHDHGTGRTIGTVHAYCNAVLWQYHGE